MMFKGQKVILRATTREDMTRQWAFENDPDVWHWDGGEPRPSSMQQLLTFFDEHLAKENPDQRSFAIDVEDVYIGHCGLYNFEPTPRTCELGIELGDHAYWGKGYGRDAVRVLLDYAFLHMNMNRVWLNTHSENERAMRCYKACGFVEEGRLRQHLWINGRYIDRVVMGLLRTEISKPTP